MSREDRAQPLGNDVIIEYIVHGKFFYKESDVNPVPGAWWVPLRRMVKQLSWGPNTSRRRSMVSTWRSRRCAPSQLPLQRTPTRPTRSEARCATASILGYPGIVPGMHILGYPGTIAYRVFVIECCRASKWCVETAVITL